MNIHQRLAQHSPPHRIGECWAVLKRIAPGASEGDRLFISLWWSGKKLPVICRKRVIKALYKEVG